MKNDRDIMNKFACYLRDGEYLTILNLIADNCVLIYSKFHISAHGKAEIKTILEKAFHHDISGRWPIKLDVFVAGTYFNPDESIGNVLQSVVYAHEDVFPPYHKTYIYLTMKDEKIIEIKIIESGRISI